MYVCVCVCVCLFVCLFFKREHSYTQACVAGGVPKCPITGKDAIWQCNTCDEYYSVDWTRPDVDLASAASVANALRMCARCSAVLYVQYRNVNSELAKLMCLLYTVL